MHVNTALAIVLASTYSLALSLSSWLNLFSFLPAIVAFALCDNRLGVLKRTLFVNIFIVMIVANYIFVGELEQAILIFLRSNLILIFTFCLFYDKSVAQIATSAAKLGFGPKLGMIFFLSCKFIKELQNEFAGFKKRAKARNFRAKTSIFTYKTYANFIGLMVLFGFEKSRKSLNCMRMRNFNLATFAIPTKKSTKSDIVVAGAIFTLIFCHFLGAIYGM